MPSREVRLSAAEWDAELSRLRGADADRANGEELAALRRRFQDVSQNARIYHQSPHVGREGSPALSELRSQSSELILLAHRELAAFDRTEVPKVPVDCLERLLSDAANRQAELSSYLDAIQFAAVTAELAAPTIEKLLKGIEISAWQFRPLIEHLLAENRSIDPAALVPLSAISKNQVDAPRIPEWFCATAIPAVEWMRVLIKDRHLMTPHLRESELVAALLCDVGQIVLSPGPGPRRALSAMEYQRHPEISAAVIAGILDAGAEWSLIAGQHHERLDGTGFPRKLSGRQLGIPARMLSIIIRWVELLKTKAATTAPLDAIASAASTLWKETMAGGFDAAIVKDLLAAIRPELPAAVQSAVLQGTRLKLDRGHPRIAGPHLSIVNEISNHRPAVPNQQSAR